MQHCQINLQNYQRLHEALFDRKLKYLFYSRQTEPLWIWLGRVAEITNYNRSVFKIVLHANHKMLFWSSSRLIQTTNFRPFLMAVLLISDPKMYKK